MKLKDIAAIRAGRTFKGGVQESESGTLSVVQLSDLSDDMSVNWPRVLKVVPDAKYAISYLKPKDLLVVARGPHKRVILLDDETPQYAVPTQHFLFLSLKNIELSLPEFVHYYLSSSPIQQWMNNQCSGSTQSTLTKDLLENLPFPDVPIEQQSDILTCVDSVKKEINLHEQLIAARMSQLDDIATRLFTK